MTPLTAAWNCLVGGATCRVWLLDARFAAAAADAAGESSDAGVPARLAQPRASGPDGSHTSRLVTVTAIRTSKASAPRPSHTGRYTETNGITASIRLIGANGSSSVVTMWTNRNTTASSDTLRCNSSDTNRGSPAIRIRLTFAI